MIINMFSVFAQLTYPEKLDFHPSVMEESLDSSDPAYESVRTYWATMHEYSMEEIEELYVQTFDFQSKSTLYMTFYKFEDGRERGQMLAKLKETYEMFGLGIAGSELSDYLPLMCEFLYRELAGAREGSWREPGFDAGCYGGRHLSSAESFG